MKLFDTLKALDEQLFLEINSWRAPWLDQPMYWMTTPQFWIPVFALIVWLFWRKSRQVKTTAVFIGGVVLAIALADLSSTRLFKHTVKRYRPTHHLEIGPQVNTIVKPNGKEYRGGKYGFVSSHAANFFAVASLAFILLGRQRKHLWLFIWAALVAYTRIYLGVHYPADLICGAVLGIACGWVAALASLRLARKINPEFAV